MSRVWVEEAVSNSEGTTFEKEKVRALRSKSREIDPTIWIGKEGASAKLVAHVKNQLKARGLVKLKVQKAALLEAETVILANRVAEGSESTLVEVIGHTFTLYKKRDPKKRG